MSFQEEKRNSIKRYLLEKIRNEDIEYNIKTIENFGVSITTVRQYIKELLEQGILEENIEKRCGYQLAAQEYCFSYNTSDYLNEDKIYRSDIWPVIEKLSTNAKDIWMYAFTEMMNNAIEHAKAKNIRCRVIQDALYTEISIADDGIGIFKNIQNYLERECGYPADVEDAILELHKGKFTTQREEHSGEGIFFVSKVIRKFAIWSQAHVFVSGRYSEEELIQSHLIAYYTKLSSIGTMVVMKLENDTDQTLKKVFNTFAPIEKGFVKTIIPLKQVCPYGEPIARSQARRIVYRLEQFKQVEIDCRDIEFMGQGFADEVFRVFQNKYPKVKLEVTNANETVLGMIRHVNKFKSS